LLTGGSSWANAASLLILRPVTVIYLTALFLLGGFRELRRLRPIFYFLAALAALMIVQLIPLPPDLWSGLPGREAYLLADRFLGEGQRWRPISLVPDRTIAALFSLSVPLAAVLGFASLREDQRRLLPLLVLAGALISGALGIMQFAGGENSPLQFYVRHHVGLPNGVFANRNHHALLLAIGIVGLVPLLRQVRLRGPSAALVTCLFTALLLLMVTILASGSRTGALLGVLAAAAAMVLSSRGVREDGTRSSWTLWAVGIVPLMLAVASSIFVGRATSVERAIAFTPESEARVELTPLAFQAATTFFPVGAGFGTFDPIFRRFETDASLTPKFYNRAHNDFIEILFEAGLGGGLLLLLLIMVAAFSAWRLFRRGRGSSREAGLSGAVIMLLVGLGSITDYPLRTPLIAAVFTLAFCLLLTADVGSGDGKRSRDGLPS